MATVLIVADICPIGRNRPYFQQGDAKTLFNDLLSEFHQADLAIANLECPLIDRPSPILKTGPVFGEDGRSINALKGVIDVLSLANNHILDHGAAGLTNTLAVCARAGIATVGAGPNLEAARRPVVRTVDGIRIAILAVAEHEFSVAVNGSPGANPLDLINFVRDLKKHRAEFDYLIVLLHGGDEFFVPSPRIKETCHFMIEMGANAVFVQHPHCLGGYETYQNGHIVYGQGALLMDEEIYRQRSSFHEGFVVKLSINSGANSSMQIIPFVQSGSAPGARRMSPDKEQQFLRELDRKAKAVLDDACVQAQWVEFCEDRKFSYLSGILGHNRILRKLNGRGAVTSTLYGKRNLLRVKNCLACETHREAIETIFNCGLL